MQHMRPIHKEEPAAVTNRALVQQYLEALPLRSCESLQTVWYSLRSERIHTMLARLFNGALLMAAAGLAASLSVGAKAGELKLGDSAPTLKVSKFVKGDPVTKFQHGKIYVVEFWATWCGPCRTSIPHLTEMAKKYKSVQFVGVSVWENKQADVAPFVKEMGDKMGYTVAMDDVPAGKTGNEGYMAENWMSAAHQDGIPTAFVIDKDTKVAWIGHPMGIDEPLGKIVAGSWDKIGRASC